jgi:putative hydrolase of the HAD superfamily
MTEKIICFDLDDTLIDDNYKFEATFCDCIRTIINALETRSPQIDDILNKAREIDNWKWENWQVEDRYLPKRIALTWVETYEYFADQTKLPNKEHIKRLLWSLVMVNYDPPYYIIPGALETLIKLKDRGYNMHLITLGLDRIQNRKIQLTRLDRYFKNVHVARTDKNDILSGIISTYGRENVVMVGNSMRSDINPALNLGIDAYYIPRGNWHRFKAEPFNSNYHELKYIDELLEIFK